MGNLDRSRLAKELEPYIASQIRSALNAALGKAALPTLGGSGGVIGITPPAVLTSHVLATATGLGTYHSISGATAGHVLRASGATTALFAQLQHGDLGGIGANDHHNQSHVLATNSAIGADHTIAGATAGHVLRASGATAAAFAQLQHTDLGNVLPDQHHAKKHDITDAAHHSIGGSALDVVGSGGGVAPVLLTPLDDVSAGTMALLRSSSSGVLTLNKLITAGAGPKVRTPLIDTQSGNLDLAPATGIVNTSQLHATVKLRAPLIDTQSGNLSIAPSTGITTLASLYAATRLRTPVLDTEGVAHLTVSPGGRMILSPSEWVQLTDGKTIRTESYTSGFLGNGFRLDQGVVEAGRTTFELDNLWVRGRLHVYELLIQQIRATNGSIFVSNTTKVKSWTLISGALGAVGSGYRCYSDADVLVTFAVGDLIRAQRWDGSGVYQCNMQVTLIAGDATYFEATLAAGDMLADSMDFVRIGSATDVNRRGGLYLTADDLGAPFMDIFDGVSSFAVWNTPGVVKTRLGKLDGLGLPGSYSNEYGLYAGNGTTDASTYIRLSSKTNRLNNLPLEWWNAGTKAVAVNSADGVVIYATASATWARSYSFHDGTQHVAGLQVNSNEMNVYGWNRSIVISTDKANGVVSLVAGASKIDVSAYGNSILLDGITTLGGNSNVVGTLYVSGATTLAAALNVTGLATVGSLTSNGAALLKTTLAVTGEATLSSNVNIGGLLTVSGIATFEDGDVRLDRSPTYRGLMMRAQPSTTWAYGLTYNNSGNTRLGSWGAYGGANTLSYLYSGVEYNDTTLRVYPGSGRVGIGANVVPSYTLDVDGTLRATGAGTFEGTLTAPTLVGTGTLFDIYHNGNRIIRNHPSSESQWVIGAGRTADGNSMLDFISAAAGSLDLRIIRNTGVNGVANILQYGTGALRLTQVGGGDVEVWLDAAARFRFSGTDFSVLSAGGTATAPLVNATTTFQRDGVDGGIFVPVSAFYMQDNNAVTWNGAAGRNIGTYVFNPQAAANNSLPAEATAIVVAAGGKWTGSASDGKYILGRGVGMTGGQSPLTVRHQVANVTTDAFAVIPVGTNGDFQMDVVGENAAIVYVRCIGYFM